MQPLQPVRAAHKTKMEVVESKPKNKVFYSVPRYTVNLDLPPEERYVFFGVCLYLSRWNQIVDDYLPHFEGVSEWLKENLGSTLTSL